MSSKRREMFLPDYLVAPGDVINDYLEAGEMSQVDLAKQTGLPHTTISNIVARTAPVTTDVATKLQNVLGRPAHFWLKLEALYQEDKARLNQQESVGIKAGGSRAVAGSRLIGSSLYLSAPSTSERSPSGDL